jgi:hypothetical protein
MFSFKSSKYVGYLGLSWALWFGFAQAEMAYPNRPIRLIVPLPPGSSTDFIARTLSLSLSRLYKQQIVVDNRPGAGGLIGSTMGAKASPDGYTFLMAAPPHTMAPLLISNPPYHPVKDFTPIANTALVSNLLVVSPFLPVKNARELASLIHSSPGKYNYASLGVGSLAHIGAEIFNHAAQSRALHIPFKFIGDAMTETLADRVHYLLFTVQSATPIVKEGRLRALAVSGNSRSVVWPDLPTFAEEGMPEATCEGWFAWIGPAGLPKSIVTKLSRDIFEVLQQPQTRDILARGGAEVPKDIGAESLSKLMWLEYDRYARLVKDGRLKAQ